jgi:hypothetical protein
MPFALIGFSYGAVLTLFFLAPRYPFSIVLAPIIQTFWGERFLHYPYQLFLLPQLFGYGKLAVDFLVGVLLTGTAITMLQQAYQNARPRWFGGLKKGIQRYGRVACIWLLMLMAAFLAMKVIVRWVSVSSGATVALVFGAEMLIQALFVFAIPVVVIEDRKIAVALYRSLVLCKQQAVNSIIFILLPNLLFVPLLYSFKYLLLLHSLMPESILYILGLRIVVAVMIDVFVISGATVLLLKSREREYGGVAL